jgi:hypothetical protein
MITMKARPLPHQWGRKEGWEEESRATLIPRARPMPHRWGKRSEVVLTMKVRPLPHQPGEVPVERGRRVRSSALPKGSASASPMGKGKRFWAVSFPEARPLPHQWAYQELGRCLADEERRRRPGQYSLQGLGRCLTDGRERRSRVALIPKARLDPVMSSTKTSSEVKEETTSPREDTASLPEKCKMMAEEGRVRGVGGDEAV